MQRLGLCERLRASWKIVWSYRLGSLSSERQAIMGFAILWVMFFHSSIDCSRFPVIATIKQLGNLGVDIFLLLSGIGLYYSALKLRGESSVGQQKNSHWVSQFYRKRIIRILPATIICLFPWYLYLYRGQLNQINLPRFFLNITSLSYWIDGTNRGWYVALTIVMYALYPLMFPLIIWRENTEDIEDNNNEKAGSKTTAISGKIRWSIPAVLIIADIVFNTAVAIYYPNWFEMVNLALGRVPVFIAGCFLAPSVRRKAMFRVLPAVSLLIGTGVLLILMRYMASIRAYAIWRYLYGILGLCVTVILSVIFQMLRRNRIGSWIRGIFAFFGKYTLEIYLTHTQVLTVLDEQLNSRMSEVAINILSVIISILLSIMIHEGLSMILQKHRSCLHLLESD